jgi:hypothetical protein
MRKIAWCGFAAAIALAACASPPSDAELKSALKRAAASVPGFSSGARVVVVNADSEMDAWTRVAQATSEGPSGLSRVLAQAFSQAEHKSLDFVVGGPYAQLTDRVLLDAFAGVRAARLPGLRVVHVSPKEPSDALREAARPLRAVLLHRPLPE